MKLLRTCFFLMLALFFMLAALGCKDSERNHHANSPAPVKVHVEKVQAVSILSSERVPGNVHASLESQLEAKIPARIVKILAKEGDLVKSGQTLIELDDREIQAKYDQANAAQKQAARDLKRFSQLLPAGAVSKQEYDAADTKAKISEAALAEAKVMLGYTHIVAPYDGIITKKLAQEGDLAVPGRPVLLFEGQSLFRFEADVPETIAIGVTEGAELDVFLTGIPDAVHGIVKEISPTTDLNSRTLHIKLDLPNTISTRSGQFGHVLIPLKAAKQLKIPREAVLEKGQLEAVFLVEEGKAILRLIRSGKADAQGVEVLSGLVDGDLLIVDRTQSLFDGARVEVETK